MSANASAPRHGGSARRADGGTAYGPPQGGPPEVMKNVICFGHCNVSAADAELALGRLLLKSGF